MSGKNYGPAVLVEGRQMVEDHVGIGRVEIACRFICEQERRIIQKCPGYGGTLFLACAECGWFVLSSVPEAKDIQELHSASGWILVGGDSGCEEYIIDDSEVRDEMKHLKDKTDFPCSETCSLADTHLIKLVSVDNHMPSGRSEHGGDGH